jgi:hypothetical protein
MTTPIPVDAFSSDLQPGETIEWSGQPNPSIMFHREDWFAIPFSLMWGGFAVFWLLAASGLWDIFQNKPNHSFQLFGIIWGTPFVIVGQYLIWGRLIRQRWQKKRMYYALTNRRALIVEYGFRNRTSSSAFFDTVPTVDKRVRHDGIGSISFGGPVTGEFQFGKSRSPRCPTFDDVENADAVYQTVLRLQDQARKSTATPQSRWPA